MSFCSGTDGFIVTWYDQSTSASNATNATAAEQYKIVSSGTAITDANGNVAAEMVVTGNYPYDANPSVDDFTILALGEGGADDGNITGRSSDRVELRASSDNLRLRLDNVTDDSSTFSPTVDGNTFVFVWQRSSTTGSFWQNKTARGTATVATDTAQFQFFLNRRVPE